MSYERDYRIKDVLQSLYGLGKEVSNNVFTNGRPQAVPEQMKDFVVVSLPSRLESGTYGGGYGNIPTFCNIEIYVKLKKSGVENLDKLQTMVDLLLSKFPYTDDMIQAARPTVLLRGNDGLGFSAVLVRAELLLK